MTVLIDSREQTPWEFPKGTKTKVQALKVGDYSLWHMTEEIAVERKSIGDWVNCCTRDWKKRMWHQLDALAQVLYSCLIIEGTPAKARYSQYRSLASPQLLQDRVAEIAAYWAVPVIYCDDRALAAFTCWKFLEHSRQAIQEKSHNGC